MTKNKIILNILIGLLFGSFFIYLLIKEPTQKERIQNLKNKGYNKQQIDSIEKKRNEDLTGAIMNLAG